MEKRLRGKTDEYIQQFKNDIKEKLFSLQINTTAAGDTNELLRFIYDYPSLDLCKEDFQKRKRVKNHVPHYLRCLANRANKEQCTRRKKEGKDFCGTHEKGTPHGIFQSTEPETINVETIEVWVQEIKGISYYIDDTGNVYNHQDVLSNNKNMSVIAKYKKDTDGNYTIPALGI